MAIDLWENPCELVKEDDQLLVRDGGEWTREKLHFLCRYLDMTTTSQVGKPFWSAVNYIDLFAGPGVCRSRDSGTRYPGSSIIAANTPKPFDRLILCEENPELSSSLRKRLEVHGALPRTEIITGDCNDRIDDIVGLIAPKSLNVAFVDPTGLHHRFETISKLTRDRRMDLIMLFADSYDINRNFQRYSEQDFSNLDAVLGPDSDWRNLLKQIPYHRPTICKFFANLYTQQLRKHLGYEHFGEYAVLRDKNTPLYRLIFASKNPLGVEFWNKAVEKSLSGQRNLF